MKEIKTYAEFWPYYLREHAEPATRGWHYVGTALGPILLVYLIFSGKMGFIAACPRLRLFLCLD